MKTKLKLITCLFTFIFLVFSVVAAIAVWIWFFAMPQPQPVTKTLFKGINYQREIRTTPRTMVIHIITVDLREKGIKFLVTPGDPKQKLPLQARTTGKFLKDFSVQLAVNGDGFQPWNLSTLFDYYPHNGQKVNAIGFAASEGIAYSQDTDNEPTLYISQNNKASFNIQRGKLYNAISGNLQIVRGKKIVSGLPDDIEPRTAYALDRANRHLMIIVIDGRQPHYSDGATLRELAQIIIDHGGYNAINMDGGGSSTLVIEGKFGFPTLLNRPINHRIPGNQRPVGNHLGIYAKPVEP